MTRWGKAVSVKANGATQPWRVLLRGVPAVRSVEGGTAQEDALGTLLIPDAGYQPNEKKDFQMKVQSLRFPVLFVLVGLFAFLSLDAAQRVAAESQHHAPDRSVPISRRDWRRWRRLWP